MRAGEVIAERYELAELAGSGGMGAVYRTLDRRSGETVALKVITAGDGEDRFRREARLLAELSHPAIVRHLGHGRTDDGRDYLVMEWLIGEDLRTRLRR